MRDGDLRRRRSVTSDLVVRPVEADLSVGRECAGLVGAEPKLRGAAELVNRFDKV